MVIKCTHCKGLMRIDERRIPAGGGVKVRCPHCSELDYVPAARPGTSRETRPLSGGRPMPPPAHSTPSEAEMSAKNGLKDKRDPTLPDDAFQEFRFPAEREIPKALRAPASRKKRFLVWAVVSLAIVLFFALLVNLVLPGPGGSRPFGRGLTSGQTQAPHPSPRQ